MKTTTFRHFLVESGKIQRDFSSVQLNLSEGLANEIISWGGHRIPEKSVFFNPDRPKFGREENIHITILYGIESTNPKVVSELLEGRKPFEVKLGNMSLFTNNNAFDVLKIEVLSPDLHDLNSILTKNLNVIQTYPEYVPHVTIAYLKKDKGHDYSGCQKFNGRKFEVSEIIFASKSGSKHNLKLGEK